MQLTLIIIIFHLRLDLLLLVVTFLFELDSPCYELLKITAREYSNCNCYCEKENLEKIKEHK